MDAPETTRTTDAPGPHAVRCCTKCKAIYRSDFLRCPTDGAEIVSVDGDPLIGTTMGEHYVIEALIGEGAMGRVYKARHARLQRRSFAVKVLLGDLAVTVAMRLRFTQEAEAASALDHPNVVRVMDFGRSESGLLYLVMDFVDGEVLADRLARGPMPVAEVLPLVRAMSEGLAHAHDRGLVHRDFKPDNVVLADGAPRIVDFGLAIVSASGEESARLTSVGVTVGTPAYAAPEQTTSDAVDHRADLFALGVTMYEMLAGMLPYTGSLAALVYQNATADVPAIATRAPGVVVPPRVEAIVRRLMARKADDRFPDARAVIAALDRLGEPVDDATPPAGLPATDLPVDVAPPPPTPAVVASRRWPYVGAGLVALAGVAVATLAISGRGHRAAPPAVTPPTAIAAIPSSVEPPTPAPAVVDPQIASPPVALAPSEPVRPAPAPPEAAPPEIVPPEIVPPGPRPSSGKPRPVAPPPVAPPPVAPPTIVSPPSGSGAAPVTPPVTPPPVVVTPPSPTKVDPPPVVVAPPVRPPPPVIVDARASIGELSARGSLSNGQVRRTIDRAAGDIGRCYLPAATAARRSPAATVKVHLTIDESGRVRDVGADGGGLPGLASCVAKAVTGVRSTAAPDVGTVAVTFAVTFQPEAR